MEEPKSLPSRGAWIEIVETTEAKKGASSGRSPHGERGLKYAKLGLITTGRLVAPLTGSVD